MKTRQEVLDALDDYQTFLNTEGLDIYYKEEGQKKIRILSTKYWELESERIQKECKKYKDMVEEYERFVLTAGLQKQEKEKGLREVRNIKQKIFIFHSIWTVASVLTVLGCFWWFIQPSSKEIFVTIDNLNKLEFEAFSKKINTKIDAVEASIWENNTAEIMNELKSHHETWTSLLNKALSFESKERQEAIAQLRGNIKTIADLLVFLETYKENITPIKQNQQKLTDIDTIKSVDNIEEEIKRLEGDVATFTSVLAVLERLPNINASTLHFVKRKARFLQKRLTEIKINICTLEIKKASSLIIGILNDSQKITYEGETRFELEKKKKLYDDLLADLAQKIQVKEIDNTIESLKKSYLTSTEKSEEEDFLNLLPKYKFATYNQDYQKELSVVKQEIQQRKQDFTLIIEHFVSIEAQCEEYQHQWQQKVIQKSYTNQESESLVGLSSFHSKYMDKEYKETDYLSANITTHNGYLSSLEEIDSINKKIQDLEWLQKKLQYPDIIQLREIKYLMGEIPEMLKTQEKITSANQEDQNDIENIRQQIEGTKSPPKNPDYKKALDLLHNYFDGSKKHVSIMTYELQKYLQQPFDLEIDLSVKRKNVEDFGRYGIQILTLSPHTSPFSLLEKIELKDVVDANETRTVQKKALLRNNSIVSFQILIEFYSAMGNYDYHVCELDIWETEGQLRILRRNDEDESGGALIFTLNIKKAKNPTFPRWP